MHIGEKGIQNLLVNIVLKIKKLLKLETIFLYLGMGLIN
jgi:hypothetical protein